MLQLPVSDEIVAVRSKKPVRLPVVLSCDEVSRIFRNMSGVTGLMTQLLYGSGLRLMEVCRLRVQDLNFANGLLMVRDGKGGKDRTTLLPTSLHGVLQQQLEKAKALFQEDLTSGNANVWLPHALARKYPGASTNWIWQYVFPAARLSSDPRTKELRRHHLDPSNIQKAVRKAVTKTSITKRVTTHTFRHYLCHPFA